MNLNSEVEQMIRKEVLEIVSKHLDIQQYKLFYFGSRVNGTNRERSDIDIGIEGNETVPYDKLHQILNDIDNIRTLYKIDFVDFKDCSEAFVDLAKRNVEYIYDNKMNYSNSLALEELKEFDRKHLSLNKMIYSKYKLQWKIIALLLWALLIVPSIYALTNIEKCWYIYVLIPFIIFCVIAFILIKYMSEKTSVIIKEYYEHIHNLNLNTSWSYQTIQIIRLKMFQQKIKEMNFDGKIFNLEKILGLLEYEIKSVNYSYKFSEIIAVLVGGVLLSSILSSFFDKIKDWDVYVYSVKQIVVSTFMLSAMFFLLDKFIFKEVTLFFRNRNKRLIQTLYHYMIES